MSLHLLKMYNSCSNNDDRGDSDDDDDNANKLYVAQMS